jgi:glycine/D-amino acid oxidase-like deaminating enzyme
MFSYWEKTSFYRYDYVVVGAGIVGLSHALELRDRFPKARIMVLERGLLPTGASTRNAGFACMGSASELLDDLQTNTEAEVVALFAARKKGLEKLRARTGDARIGYKADGGYELISNGEADVCGKLDMLNDLLRDVTGAPAFKMATEKVAEFGFAGGYDKALIENTCEAGLNTGMLVRTLMDLATECGIEVKTGADVMSFEEDANEVTVTVRDPFAGAAVRFSCRSLSLCTNAFTKKLLPDVDVIPGRGQVVVTDPIPGLKFKGIFHFDKGYYYFREIDGRVLFGGGRNLDFEGERTTEMGLNELIQADLDDKLANIILPGQSYKVAMRWSGIMAFGETKKPIVRSFGQRVFGAFRMGGMGVALGSTSAAELADLIEQR